jgi:hypothetical protein
VKTGENGIIHIAEINESAAEKNISEPLNNPIALSHQGNGNVGPKRDAELQADLDAAWERMRDFSW